VKYIDFFIFIRISEIDILDSSICAQKQLRMHMKSSLMYIYNSFLHVSILIFLTSTYYCQFGMPWFISYLPLYICMLYVKPSVLQRHPDQSECDILQNPGFKVHHIHFCREVYRILQPIKMEQRVFLVKYINFTKR